MGDTIGASTGTGPIPLAVAGRATPSPALDAAAIVAQAPTDSLKLRAKEEPFLGHKPSMAPDGTIRLVRPTLFLKAPVWCDTREKITAADWNKLGEDEQKAILKDLPDDGARASFVSSVATANSWAALKASMHHDETTTKTKAANALDTLASDSGPSYADAMAVVDAIKPAPPAPTGPPPPAAQAPQATASYDDAMKAVDALAPAPKPPAAPKMTLGEMIHTIGDTIHAVQAEQVRRNGN